MQVTSFALGATHADRQASHLPDYECAAYRRQAPLWHFLDDVAHGSEAWLERLGDGRIRLTDKTRHYLPQLYKELDESYGERVRRTPFADRFGAAIRDFVGLLFRAGVQAEGMAAAIAPHWQNIDHEGSNGSQFLSRVAAAVMRRGHSFLLVDVPKFQPEHLSLAGAALARPYWVHIHATQLKNWRHVTIGGLKWLVQATIERRAVVPDGLFGEKERVSYLRLTPGRFDVFEIRERERRGKKERYAVHMAEESGEHGYYRGGQFVALKEIPLLCLHGGARPADSTEPFESLPDLKVLADINVTHYQLLSDHLTKIHKCCFPQRVRVGVLGDEEELQPGVDTTIDVPPGGAFLFVEPNANSLAQSRTEVEALETAMDFLGAQYLVKPSDRQVSAVSGIQVAKVESGLEAFAGAFIQGANEALRVHGLFLGLGPEQVGRLTVNTRLFQQLNQDPTLLSAYTSMFERLGGLPAVLRGPLLQIAKLRGFLPMNFDVEAVLRELPTVVVANDED